MGSRVIIEQIQCHGEARGRVIEPLAPDLIPAQRSVHIALTEPGCIRGNHFHERGMETAVLIGPALVRIREDGQVRDIQVAIGEAVRFTLPPGTLHALQNTGSKPMLLVAFNTRPHDPAQPDLVRDVLTVP
jgi:UDP-2-acetamido-2,6-beta-L-arabino-hexul-4-ose reductase